MPIHHAVLGLLGAGPSYGYQLKSDFETAVGPQWGGLNIGHVYQLLERLSRDGLAEARREPQTARPDRVVYAITRAGRNELLEWLTTASPVQTGYRDDLFLKIMVASRLGDRPALEQILSSERLRLLQDLRDLSAAASTSHDPVVTLLVDSARLEARARLEFLSRARDAIPQLVARAAPETEQSGELTNQASTTERSHDSPVAQQQ